MKEIEVTGKKRTALGKKASKALRKEGMVPCNLYGELKDAEGKPVALAFVRGMRSLRPTYIRWSLPGFRRMMSLWLTPYMLEMEYKLCPFSMVCRMYD